MKYWYIKENDSCGHSDFYGYRELIYKGEKTAEKFLARYQDSRLNYEVEWHLDWRNIKEYNPCHYPHTAKGMKEITEEEMKEIINKE